jgi:hypothetical protein
MKFVLRLEDHQVILNEAQLTVFMKALSGAEVLVDHRVDKGEGTHGYDLSYIHNIGTLSATAIRATVLDETTYGAIKFITKQGVKND